MQTRSHGFSLPLASSNMPHQPDPIPAEADLALLECTSFVYMAFSLYVGACNVAHLVRNWRRLKLDAFRGPLFMHMCLNVAAPLSFIGENVWNQVGILDCYRRYWLRDDCRDWKRWRNTLSALSEAMVILFFWLRSRTFYNNPLISGLFISNELFSRVLSYVLLAAIVGYPFAYTAYSMSHFWFEHHEYLYLVTHHLCYVNYTNNPISPVGSRALFTVTNLTLEARAGVSEEQHHDPVPMVASTGFIAFQLLLHLSVIIPFLVPFVQFVKDRQIPEVNILLKRCLIITGVLFLLNILTWVFGQLLAPVMPISKFLLDAIADARICGGIILASSAMSNWRQILMPWRNRNAKYEARSVHMQVLVTYRNTAAFNSTTTTGTS